LLRRSPARPTRRARRAGRPVRGTPSAQRRAAPCLAAAPAGRGRRAGRPATPRRIESWV